jgi:hypothetical protein
LKFLWLAAGTERADRRRTVGWEVDMNLHNLCEEVIDLEQNYGTRSQHRMIREECERREYQTVGINYQKQKGN